MKNNLVIGISTIASIILVFVGVYLVTNISRGDDLITKKNKLQNSLTLTQEKLKKEKETLETLTKNLRDSFPLAANIQDQMKKSSEIVRQTDFMFENPYGLDPQFIIDNLLASVAINNQRKNINLLLEEWKKKTDISLIDKIDLSESEQIKKDAEAIKTFIEDLSKIANGLTPTNSGLSQFQIDIYITQLPSVAVINEVLVSIENTIENSNTNNIDRNNNPNPENYLPSTPVTIAPEVVVVQQQVVANTQTEVINLQEQLAEVEEEIQKTTVFIPTEDNVPINIPSANDIENQNSNNTQNQNQEPPNDPDTDQGILVQPGPPRLIQGTDPF